MSSTKIINVLKDDSFQEILALFKATPAEEVIFVLPKRSKAFQKEDHFVALRSEAKSLDKTVSFLCSNPELNDLAKKYHFDVLLARSPVPRKSSRPANSINIVNQIEDFYSEPALDADSISIAKPALEEESNKDLDFEEEPNETSMPVEVHQSDFSDESLEHRALHEIKSIWGSTLVAPEVKATLVNSSWTKWFRRSPKISRSTSTKQYPIHRTGLVVLACASVIVLGTVVFISTGKAQITIKPNSTPLDERITVFSSDNTPSINQVSLAIPGQVFNIEKTVSQNFTATGHVDVAQKARGTITVYSELSTTQQLVATTRFESADHHIFHTLTGIVVPAAKTSNGKLLPGSVEVQVIADKPGSDYNVAVGLFTVTAFKEKGDTVKFQKVYGQSTAAMHSGTSGQATVVTESDLATAKQALTTQLTANIQDDLKSQIDGLKVINDTGITVGQPVSTNPADSATTTFTVNLSGSLKTVGFKQSDLDSLIAQYLDSQKNATVLADKLTLEYENVHWDAVKGGLLFTVYITGPGYAKVDQEQIINDILGKDDSQIKAYLGGITGISEAHVSLSPFWVRSIPRNKDRVHVDLSY